MINSSSEKLNEYIINEEKLIDKIMEYHNKIMKIKVITHIMH